mmetsp:Transcript_70271/g.201344  ORF Transcript_70271/g.201344 Transcript_70271/m.201344 type:complete len:255 (+) Transcript_70271:97-861(+)
MSRRPIFCGNWKCKLETLEAARKFVEEFNEELDDGALAKVDVVFFPSALHAMEMKRLFKSGVATGLQNLSAACSGEGFTGELTAVMALDVGCEWALVGHSDRRHRSLESLEDAALKVERAQEAGLGVVFCIGELLEEREAGRTVEVCQQQLGQVLPKVRNWQKFAVVYEPIWAMGTGVAATREQAQEAHHAVREIVRETSGAEAAEALRILYGGAVNVRSCEGFVSQPDIDGFLGLAARPTDVANMISGMANSV